MDKQYTAEYFLEFFRKIPAKKWSVGLGDPGGPSCALGHLGCKTSSDQRPDALALGEILRPVLEESYNYNTESRLSPNVVVFRINDDTAQTYVKGKTPRGRILSALRKAIRVGKSND